MPSVGCRCCSSRSEEPLEPNRQVVYDRLEESSQEVAAGQRSGMTDPEQADANNMEVVKGANMLKSIILSLGVAALVAFASTDSIAQQPGGPYAVRQMSGMGPQGAPGQLPPGAVVVMPAPRGYPQMHAPMYPSPVPNVPTYVGGTTYTNQAFAPHEMLYPHEYKALYPPFYHKVSGKWWWTPFGMESHDKWELQGTEVKVKYRSSYRWCSGFCPPTNW